MAQPGYNDMHVNALLTQMSIGYVNEIYIAEQIFPQVLVVKRSDIIPKYDKSYWFRDEVQELAPMQPAPVSGYEVDTSETYFCKEYGLAHPLADQMLSNTDDPFDPNRDGMEWLMDKMSMAKERYFVSNFWKTSVWGADKAGGSDFTKWDTYGTSTPVVNLRDWKRSIRHLIARNPTTLVLGDHTFDVLSDHPVILDRVKYGASQQNPAVVTTNLIAQLLGLSKVLVGTSIYTASVEGTAEASVTYTANWGDHGLLLYQPNAPSLFRPAAGYNFLWKTAFGGPQYFRKRREPLSDKGWLLEIYSFWNMKVTASDAGLFISDTAA